jgi:hypothetical protein
MPARFFQGSSRHHALAHGHSDLASTVRRINDQKTRIHVKLPTTHDSSSNILFS